MTNHEVHKTPASAAAASLAAVPAAPVPDHVSVEPAPETGSTIVSLVSKVFGAVLIPSVATIIFNLLNFFFENYQTNPLPPLNASVYDISVGCAFSLIGIAVTVKDRDLTQQFIILFVVLLFLVLGGLIIPVFVHWSRLYTVWCINILSLFVLSWAIMASD